MGTVTDYGRDLLVWSERQAERLRRVASGDRVSDQIDRSHIAEEIEALGKSERRKLQNRIAGVLLHLIQLQAPAATDPRAGWRETSSDGTSGCCWMTARACGLPSAV